jgi:hypothetical protein
MYLAALAVMLALVFLGSVSAAATDDDTTPIPPACPPHGKQAVLNTGTTPDGQAPLYFRFCGRARFTASFGADTIRVRGFCDARPTVPTSEPTTAYRWLQGGLIKNGPATPAVRGLALVLSGPNPPRAGVVRIIDGIFQVPGIDSALDGTAVVGKGWQRGHFWVTARSSAPQSFDGVTITGSWDCRRRVPR